MTLVGAGSESGPVLTQLYLPMAEHKEGPRGSGGQGRAGRDKASRAFPTEPIGKSVPGVLSHLLPPTTSPLLPPPSATHPWCLWCPC